MTHYHTFNTYPLEHAYRLMFYNDYSDLHRPVDSDRAASHHIFISAKSKLPEFIYNEKKRIKVKQKQTIGI